MRITSLNFILFSLIVVINSTVQAPVWPERFAQSMTVNFKDLTTTGRYWYDSKINAERYDFQNGNSKNSCGAIHQANTPCSYLIQGGWFYMVYPQKSLCCKLVELQAISRNWMQDFTYLGQKEIDGELFSAWDENLDQDEDVIYYGEKTERKRPRRQYAGKRVYLDYWMQSFTERQISPSVFQVPSYCLKRCWDHFRSQSQFQAFIVNLRNFNIRIPLKSYNKGLKFQE